MTNWLDVFTQVADAYPERLGGGSARSGPIHLDLGQGQVATILERPVCAVCNRQADRLTVVREGETFHFVVECHGAREESSMTRNEMAATRDMRVEQCFVERAALPAPDRLRLPPGGDS